MRYDSGDLQSYGSLEWKDGRNLLAFRDILHSPKQAQEGHYNTAFHVKVISGEYAGLGEWECDWNALRQFGEELEELYQFQRNEVEFRDIEWGNWLRFALKRTGQINVSGFLQYVDHELKFEFCTDQTTLKPFLQRLRQICSMTKDEGVEKQC